jgi:formamidopyrimidine-DNA glycosylase
MPELPEVETIRRTLAPGLVGKTIRRVEVRSPKFIVGASPEQFRAATEGATVVGLDRRGKFLIINLKYSETSAGASLLTNPPDTSPGPTLPGDIVIHLKMAGQLILCRPGEDLGPTRTKHTHVIFHLDDNSELRYLDLRHFGRVYFPPGGTSDPVLGRALRTIAGLGPEPREGGLEWESFRRDLARRQARVKPLLLDQAFVAGLGNIYADECLFRAKVHPLRRASSLTDQEAKDLYQAMFEVIEEAIDRRGTSVRDYVDGEGRPGLFAGELRAYGRTGQPCLRCGAAIQRLVVGGRSSHFCPLCQPDGARTDV